MEKPFGKQASSVFLGIFYLEKYQLQWIVFNDLPFGLPQKSNISVDIRLQRNFYLLRIIHLLLTSFSWVLWGYILYSYTTNLQNISCLYLQEISKTDKYKYDLIYWTFLKLFLVFVLHIMSQNVNVLHQTDYFQN